MSANDELQAHTCEKVVEEYENIKQTVIKCGYGNCPFTDEFCVSGDCPYDPDNIVEMKEMITVKKEVYEAVLRNSVKVADLEAENKNLKNVLNVCKEVFQELYNTTEHFNVLYKQLDKFLKEK